jgi:hypothetical protein
MTSAAAASATPTSAADQVSRGVHDESDRRRPRARVAGILDAPGVLKEGLAKKANKSKGQKRATVYTGA